LFIKRGKARAKSRRININLDGCVSIFFVFFVDIKKKNRCPGEKKKGKPKSVAC
jgi:hypothetical protein